MPIVVERTFVVPPRDVERFEELSRLHIWPYMEARGCKILGLFTIVHGGPNDELVLLTAYDSLAHWEATRLNRPPEEGGAQLRELWERAAEAARERAQLTVRTHTRVLGPVTDWVDYGVRPG